MTTSFIKFINPETMAEEKGKYIKTVGLFKVKIKSVLTGKVYIIDIDDLWASR